MTTLIVGGSSGLGLAMAKELTDGGDQVWITGRTKPQMSFVKFVELDLSKDNIAEKIDGLVISLPEISRLVYSSGLYQAGRITDLPSKQIEEMVRVTGTALIFFMRSILSKQDKLDELVTITSTSQWMPRKEEPIYSFAKAGIGQFSNSMAEDGRVGKVLVAAPSAMRTKFWDKVKRDNLDKMLDKEWVAQRVIKSLKGDYKYKFIKILAQPARVEEADKR